MKKLKCINFAEVFKIGKTSKNLKNKKCHKCNVSSARKGKLYRSGNHNFMRFYMKGSKKKLLKAEALGITN